MSFDYDERVNGGKYLVLKFNEKKVLGDVTLFAVVKLKPSFLKC